MPSSVLLKEELMRKRPTPPFDPKLIFVQEKAKDYQLYQKLNESFPGATFEEFEGRHDAIPILIFWKK